MTRSIGEVFTFFNHKCVVVESGGDDYLLKCGRCVLNCSPCDLFRDITGECGEFCRGDRKNVHFEKFGVDW